MHGWQIIFHNTTVRPGSPDSTDGRRMQDSDPSLSTSSMQPLKHPMRYIVPCAKHTKTYIPASRSFRIPRSKSGTSIQQRHHSITVYPHQAHQTTPRISLEQQHSASPPTANIHPATIKTSGQRTCVAHSAGRSPWLAVEACVASRSAVSGACVGESRCRWGPALIRVIEMLGLGSNKKPGDELKDALFHLELR